MLSVGGGTLPHTLQEARSGVIEAQSTGPVRMEPAWALQSSFLKLQTCDNVVKKANFISRGALIFLAPVYLSLQHLFMGKEVGAPFYRSGKCG